jgi:hypothetical protein
MIRPVELMPLLALVKCIIGFDVCRWEMERKLE